MISLPDCSQLELPQLDDVANDPNDVSSAHQASADRRAKESASPSVNPEDFCQASPNQKHCISHQSPDLSPRPNRSRYSPLAESRNKTLRVALASMVDPCMRPSADQKSKKHQFGGGDSVLHQPQRVLSPERGRRSTSTLCQFSTLLPPLVSPCLSPIEATNLLETALQTSRSMVMPPSCKSPFTTTTAAQTREAQQQGQNEQITTNPPTTQPKSIRFNSMLLPRSRCEFGFEIGEEVTKLDPSNGSMLVLAHNREMLFGRHSTFVLCGTTAEWETRPPESSPAGQTPTPMTQCGSNYLSRQRRLTTTTMTSVPAFTVVVSM